MARFSLSRAVSYSSVIILFTIVMWLYSSQLDSEAASKQERQLLEKKISQLQEDIDRIEKSKNGYLSFEVGAKHQIKEAFGSFVSPNLKAKIDQDSCVFASNVKSTADIQTVDLYKNITFKNIDGGVWKQGYPIMYKEDTFAKRPLQVFVVPHSHNDPGWLKTFEKYFADQTKKILDNVVAKLEQDADRRFIWAEISFFSLWWSSCSESMRKRAVNLIQKGQLEIVTGGWVMEDEANTHYYAMVDQMIEGSHWIKDNLGIVSHSAWSIDPFGQSPTVAYLRQRMGFKNMLIQRTHYEVKKALSLTRNLEFTWRQNWDKSGETDIFCHMMPFYSYDVPHSCGPDPSLCCQFDFARLPPTRISCPWKKAPKVITDDNVEERAAVLVDQLKKKSQLYKSNVVLYPLGDDFRYDNMMECDKQFSNYEKLFKHINSNPDLHTEIRWGTLSEYFHAAHSRLQQTNVATLSGDFFTYADREDHYWSGYFTSRPFYKQLDRVVESRLRSAEIIFSLANVFTHSSDNNLSHLWKDDVARKLLDELVTARRNLGLFQHHDGITGTAKDAVVVDYGRKLLTALNNADHVISTSAQLLLLSSSGAGVAVASGNGLDQLNIDHDRANHDSLPKQQVIKVSTMFDHSKYPLVFYNSLALQRQQLVSVVVDHPHVKVTCHAGSTIPSQIAPRWSTSEEMTMQPNEYELWFQINIHPLSLSRYFIHKVPPEGKEGDPVERASFSHLRVLRTRADVGRLFPSHGFDIENANPSAFHVENYHYKLDFAENGLLQAITDRRTDKTTQIGLNFGVYGTVSKKDKSGAYLFLPDGPAKTLPSLSAPVVVETGPVVSRVTVKLDNVIHVVRLHNSPGVDGQVIAISNLVDIRALSNRELVMSLKVHDIVKASKTFYTDLNGFQMQARHFLTKLPLQANFYPMPSQVVVESPSHDTRVSLHSAQSLGVGMNPNLDIDVILDRRLMQDDNRGVAQGVKDNKLTPNDFWLTLESFVGDNSGSHSNSRPTDISDYTVYPTLFAQHANLALNSPILTLIPKSTGDSSDTQDVGFKSQSNSYVPCDTHILNLRTMKLQPLEALLVLHRQGHSCRETSFGHFSPTNCSSTSGVINFSTLFNVKSAEPLSFSPYTLNGITSLGDQVEKAELKPQELSTYLVKYHQ